MIACMSKDRLADLLNATTAWANRNNAHVKVNNDLSWAPEVIVEVGQHTNLFSLFNAVAAFGVKHATVE